MLGRVDRLAMSSVDDAPHSQEDAVTSSDVKSLIFRCRTIYQSDTRGYPVPLARGTEFLNSARCTDYWCYLGTVSWFWWTRD